MNSRERVLCTINHKIPDRVPIDLGATRVSGISVFAYNRLKQYLGLDLGRSKVCDVYQMLAWPDQQIIERFHIDVLMAPKLKHRLNTRLDGWQSWELFDGSEVLMPGGFNPSIDEEGNWIIVENSGATARMPAGGLYFDYIESSLSTSASLLDVDKFSFEKWTDEDFRFCEEQARLLYQGTDKALIGDFGIGLGKPGSYEEWLITLASNPHFIREYYDKKSDFIVAQLVKYAQAMDDRICAIFFGQDFGTQIGEMISPKMFQELIAPYYKKIFSWVHKHTKWKVFFHCCGSIYRLIPILIDCGVDILNPVQCTAARMDPVQLKKEFGDKLIFWGGGVDTQTVLPRGTFQDVKQQVKERIEILSPGGGFVFNPIHNIQNGVPPENIVACYDAAFEYGNYSKNYP